MPDAPEDRAAAARRADHYRQMARDWERGDCDERCALLSALVCAADDLTDTLLAIPGGDAEPVAWRVVYPDGERHLTEDAKQAATWIDEAPSDASTVTLLYVAPGGRPVTDAGFTCAFCGRMYDGPQPVAEFCTKRPGDGKCLPGGRPREETT